MIRRWPATAPANNKSLMKNVLNVFTAFGGQFYVIHSNEDILTCMYRVCITIYV